MNEPLTWGLKDNAMVNISDVENGLKCECVCAGCRGVLIAKNKGEVRTPHFAHLNEECKNAQESALHRLAKELIAKRKVIKLPEYKGIKCPDFNTDGWSYELEYGGEKGVRPDLVFYQEDKMLFIEVAVTNPVSQEKRDKLLKIGTPTLQFNLKPFFNTGFDVSKSQVNSFIDACYCHWIVNLKKELEYKQLMDEQFKKQKEAENKQKELDFEQLNKYTKFRESYDEFLEKHSLVAEPHSGVRKYDSIPFKDWRVTNAPCNKYVNFFRDCKNCPCFRTNEFLFEAKSSNEIHFACLYEYRKQKGEEYPNMIKLEYNQK